MNPPNIQFLLRSGMLVLHVQGGAQEEDFQAVPEMMGRLLGQPGTPPLSGIVVDLKNSADMNEAAWRKLSAHLTAIPGRNRFFIVSAPATMQPLLTASRGLAGELLGTVDEVFNKIDAARKLLQARPATPRPPDDTALEKQLIKAFQAAALQTFEVQCSTIFRPGIAYLKSSGPKIIHDIAASMGLMGRLVSGSVALGFKEETFLKIMGKMLGEQYTGITSEVEDGCGELLNIAFGQAKKILSEEGHQFGKTLPTIFTGQSLRVRQLTPNPAFVLPFESDLGEMFLELGYRHT